MTEIAVRRALISVSDKRGLTLFAKALVESGVEIVSSGGTAAHLEADGIAVTSVESVTGAPEMLGGRVKTLHPNVHGGILADMGSEDHRRDLTDLGIDSFQLVVANLYPFGETIAAGADHATAVENIDIGGPTLIRAAAKNHAWVAVVVSPDRYEEITAAIEAGGTTAELRADLAQEGFFRTAQYDAAIVNWLHSEDDQKRLVLALEQRVSLRYGENPHQPAALYGAQNSDGWWAQAEQLQGREMSFNNYADADAAWRLVNDLSGTSVVILKHTNACGVASASSLEVAFTRAWACDPVSAFGGVIACSTELDAATAAAVSEHFVEVILAPSITDDAKEVFARKKNLRVVIAPPPSSHHIDVRSIDDGFLVQVRDHVGRSSDTWETKTREPTESERSDLEMAWIVAAHTKSNAIVLVKDGAAVGVGAGDQSRVGAVEQALARAGDRAVGTVCASDAFFPFRDGPDLLAEAGVTAIVEPGGSIRDDEVIASAKQHGVALAFTGERHFKH